MTGANQQDVAGLDAHALFALGGFEVLDGHVLSRLQPPDPAEAGNVEQHTRPTSPSRSTSIDPDSAPRSVTDPSGIPS